jgi:PAS domain-containing protein
LATRSQPRIPKPKKDKAPSPARWLEEFNRAILDSALDCIITMDATGRVREFNPAAERTFGKAERFAPKAAASVNAPHLLFR